jgi:hypothetical protein
MEMKETDVKKFLTLMESCIAESKIENRSIVTGLNDPLELLRDIEIDAPLARSHLALIISELMKWGAIELSMLKDAPEYFRTDGKPAAFAVKILKTRGTDPTNAELDIVGSLMSEEDKGNHASAKSMYDSLS